MSRTANERVFKIIVPITEQSRIEDISGKMTNRFGGATILPLTRGFWLSNGKPVYDDSVMIFSARDIKEGQDHIRIFREDWDFMKNIAGEVGRDLKQEAVYVEQDIIREVEFVPPAPYKKMEEVV